MLVSFHTASPPPPRDEGVRVLYKHHVESFSRLDDSSIAVGSCWHLYVTHDLGKTWSLVGELPERNIIKQIVWIDSEHVVVNASFTGHGKIYYSCDGGRSFETSLTNTAASDGIVWDTASGRLYAVDNLNRFYVSYNKGRTWRRRGSRIPFEQRPRVSHFCSLVSFAEHGGRIFYATSSYPGQICRSRDTGRHWQRVFADARFRNREIPKLGRLHDGRFFAVSAEGIIDAPGGVLIGSRDGSHWTIISAPEGTWDFAELPSKPGFIAAGGFSLGRNAGDAALFFTNNYGTTWHRQEVLAAALVWQVEYSHPDSWLLATDKGLLELNLINN